MPTKPPPERSTLTRAQADAKWKTLPSETEEHPALEAHLFLPSWPAAVACILFIAGVMVLSAIGAACLLMGGHHG